MFKEISKPVSVVAGLMVTASTLALAVAPSAYATSSHTTPACVDGSKRANLSVKWNANDSISFNTINNKNLCNDVTVFFSSYVMPDNYNGKGFSNNPTASPQSVFDSKSFVMAKGTTGASTLKIDLPEACKNIQVDLYYAPEIKVVTAAGHGSQYITGKIIDKTVDSCTPVSPEEPEVPVTPEVPEEEAQTPPTPAPQVTLPTPAPAELPHTGSEAIVPVAVAAIVAAISYAGSLVFKRQ
jgi:hypothetical protein